jgi:type II secretory pathway pseudopilin PulG
MSAPARRRAAGFTVYELVVAILLIGIAIHPLVTTLSANTRIAADRRDRLAAERLMRNESALLDAADPELILLPRAYSADADGRSDPAGPFLVTTEMAFRCAIGPAPSDNAADPPPARCGEGGVVADYTVTVQFPRTAGSDEAGPLVHHFSVAVRRPHAVIGGMP